MKCAKCGHDIPDRAFRCPWCAAFGERAAEREDRVCCPGCGSPDIDMLRKTYSPGCGCLGLLLLGWWGLLLGLFGAGTPELICRRCGMKWEAGRPDRAVRSGGCCSAVFWIVIIIILLGMCL